MQRKCKDWLSTYLKYSQFSESPKIFHQWSALSVLASILERRIYMNRGYGRKCYVNQYIILVGESAVAKKSSAVDMAVDLYNNIVPDNPVVSKKITVQKLTKNLDKIAESTGNSFAYVYSTELSVLVSNHSNDRSLLNFLTEVYPCPDFWENDTKTAGNDKLRNLCINFIGCTTPRDLALMPEIMIDGGFAGRVIFIASEGGGVPMYDPEEQLAEHPEIINLKIDLLYDLQIIQQIKGVYTFSTKARKEFKWLYDMNYRRQTADERIQPFQKRLGEHILSIAMLLQAAKTDSLELTNNSILTAASMLNEVEQKLPDALSFITLDGSPNAKYINMFMTYLKKNDGRIKHYLMLRYLSSRGVTKGDMEIIADTLKESKQIIIQDKKGNSPRMYFLNEQFKFKDIMERIKT